MGFYKTLYVKQGLIAFSKGRENISNVDCHKLIKKLCFVKHVLTVYNLNI